MLLTQALRRSLADGLPAARFGSAVPSRIRASSKTLIISGLGTASGRGWGLGVGLRAGAAATAFLVVFGLVLTCCYRPCIKGVSVEKSGEGRWYSARRGPETTRVCARKNDAGLTPDT